MKAGLLLALLGGTKSETFRAESHVLIVGDPGLGKSQMLKACSNVAPRGKMASQTESNPRRDASLVPVVRVTCMVDMNSYELQRHLRDSLLIFD